MSQGILRRSRLQVHLSAAVLLMFVAGGILWVTLHRRRVTQNVEIDNDINDFDKSAFDTMLSKNPSRHCLGRYLSRYLYGVAVRSSHIQLLCDGLQKVRAGRLVHSGTNAALSFLGVAH